MTMPARWRSRYGDAIDRLSAADLIEAIRRGSAITSLSGLDARAAEIAAQTRERLSVDAYRR